MKRFIQRWLGITSLFKEIREYFNDIRVLNHLISTLDTRIISLEKTKIDEDVSAEVQALKENKKYLKSVLTEDNNDIEDMAYWEYMASYKEDSNDK